MGKYEDLLNLAIEIGQKNEIDEILAQMTAGKTYQIRFSNSAIDNSKIWDNDVLEIFLAMGQKNTQIDIEAPNREKIEETINRTAKFLKKMPNNVLYGGMETESKSHVTIKGLFDDRIRDFSEKAPELINTAIQSSLDSGAKKVAGVLYFGDIMKELQTSHGVSGSYKHSYYRLTVRSFVDGQSSGQDVLCGRNFSDIESKFIKSGEAAGNIAKMAVGGKQGKSGKYDLIMSPTVAANVLGQVTEGAHPIKMMIGMSPLTTNHISKQIAVEELTVEDDALIGDGLGSRPFDVEGTPTGKTRLITNGVLTNLLHNISTSKMAHETEVKTKGCSTFFDFGIGSKFLAPGASNTVFKGGDQTLEEIIAECQKPTIYITSNWYTRYTNMIEGSFSTIPRDGMFLIEKGEIKRPIRKLRLSDNLLGMCSRISAIGKDIRQILWWEVPTPTFIPTIKVDDCNITSATQ